MSFVETRVENCELPETWSSGRLDEVCYQMKQGKILPQKEIHETGSYPVFGANGCIGYCEDYFLEEQRVLITCRGSTCGVINRSPARSFVTNNAMILFEKDCLDNDFLFFVLQEFSTMGLKTGSGQPQLTQGILNSHAIPLPPLPEQKKIAHILSTVQRAIEAQERIIQTTTELKKALMHKLFTEGLPRRSLGEGGPPRHEPQNQTEIGPVPESWEVCKVGDVAKIQSGGTPTREVAENWSGGTIPWVKTGEINYCVIHDTEEKITPTGLANSPARLYPKGTLLMAMYGQGITRGRVGLLGIEGATNQACASITPTDEKRISSAFLYYFFDYHYEDLRQLGHGANQRNMNAALIRSFPISFPKADEQADIVAALESLDTKSLLHGRKREQLQDLFRTLLHELMTAKTRVHAMELSA